MGLKINGDKTEVQFLGKGDKQFDIHVDGHSLKQTEKVVYLGGTISSKEGSGADVQRRITLARGIFYVLNKVWISKELKKATKLEVFETLVLSALLYNSQTWNMKATSKRRIRVFEMACLRKNRRSHKNRQITKFRDSDKTELEL